MKISNLKEVPHSGLRVLVADDHRLVSEAVATILQNHGFEAEILSSYYELEEALSSGAQFDIVLLDIDMPGMVGVASLREILETGQVGQVLLFSGSIDPGTALQARSAGAAGAILKTTSLAALPSILRFVAAGEEYFPASMVAQISQRQTTLNDLSEDEKEVLKLVASGSSNKEISYNLNVAESTIKMHIRNIFRKTGCKNRAHAAVFAKEHNLTGDG
ncbi:response regulator transcription factor [Tropicibacter alexandrii]|uniref:response regulator transcription factor n=1 Tax=Tropicibacter alexandrii TaxID=2267683 RepID=UPI000EF4731C|nr:response regulator transcription factor [Tropicibacter alexandrii]